MGLITDIIELFVSDVLSISLEWCAIELSSLMVLCCPFFETILNSFKESASASSGFVIYVYLFLRKTMTGRQ